MVKHDTLSDADHTSLSTSDKGQPVVTYVRVGRGMIKTNPETGSIHSFDSSQPHSARAPSVKSASAGGGKKSGAMPTWVPKFKRSKKGKKALDETSRDQRRISSPINLSVDYSGQVPISSNDDPSTYASTEKRDTLAPPAQHPAMLTPPSSPIPTHSRPLRAAHSHNDLPTAANPSDMWNSIAQLETELVARYGRGAVPQLEALRERMQNMQQDDSAQYETEGQPVYQQIEWAEDTRYSRDIPRPNWQANTQRARSTSRVRTRTETLPGRLRAIPPVPPVPPVPYIPNQPTRAFVDDLDVYPGDHPSPIQPSISTSHSIEEQDLEEGDSDDAAAYLQALGLEPSTTKEPKPKTRVHAPSSSVSSSQARHPQPARSATLPTASTYSAEDLAQAQQDALIASIVNNPTPEILEQYAASRHHLSRLDYITTQRAHSNEALGLIVDPSVSSRSASPMISSAPDSPATRSQSSSSRRDLPPRPPPPSTSAPYAPIPPVNAARTQPTPRLLARDSPIQQSPTSFPRMSPRPQQSPMSLTVPSPHALRSAGSSPSTNGSQLALPLVRVRITCPPQRGALRQLPAFVLLNASARASFAAATWAQMVTYCARNAGVSIARRGGGGVLQVSVEERMAELTTPGGGRGVGDEEVGFGLGYYVSVEMTLEGEAEDHGNEGSVPIATMSIPLPVTLGEIAIVFRERKDIRKALS
ncbi:hypothetical protein RSOLAG22IIIB_00239 [Rhizoctonia solani]|uniref:Uncharacterized protein n=1 Tax=Rhizoctonia solani TaxID=456999 RepID=A0A0K6FKP0_9AGAM|nr:hypothetical protein RSOLAG22IIIB_00239 [Rhizoctonia solani]